MRLDKFLAHTTDLTRSLAKHAIKQQRVQINGVAASDAGQFIHPHNQVLLDGQPLTLIGNRYLMLHKPAGYVCTHDASHHATIFSLLEQGQNLHAAGRLDADTTGLVLLTNDGQWSHRVTSPRRECNKIYCVNLQNPIDNIQIQQLEQGILLEGEDKPTLPAHVQVISDLEIKLTIHEGKYHQVKRMLTAIGNHVIALHRETIGKINLDKELPPGSWRDLTAAEVDRFS